MPLLSEAMPTILPASAQIVATDIMTRKLVTLTPETEVFDAIDRLLKHRISGAPVVDSGNRKQFIGLFSERNAVRLLVDAAYDGHAANTIYRFVDTDVHTITGDVDLLSIAQLFLHSNQRRLPVVEEDRLIGQVSRRDVLRAAHTLMQDVPDAPHQILLYLSSLREMAESPRF